MSNLKCGTIVSWQAPGKPVPIQALRAALITAGFSDELARDMAPRSAFRRSCKELEDNRVIDKVDEGDDEITFQFTARALKGTEFEYEKECMVYLDKGTGRVRCPECSAIAQHAEQLVQHHLESRNSGDITRLIQKIFENEGGDLVPIRKQGGVYFVPFTHAHLVEKTAKLLSEVGGSMLPFEIQQDEKTSESVASSMVDHLSSLIAEFRDGCEALSVESTTRMIEVRVNRIMEIRSKLEAYQSLLGGFSENIQREIEEAQNAFLSAATRSAETQAA